MSDYRDRPQWMRDREEARRIQLRTGMKRGEAAMAAAGGRTIKEPEQGQEKKR